MKTKLFNLIALLVALSMVATPALAAPQTSTPASPPAPPKPDSKLKLEAVDPSSISVVNSGFSVKGNEPAVYIIQLDDPPAATYQGGVAGLAPTSPLATGKGKLDVNAPVTKAYVRYLAQKQNQLIQQIEAFAGHPVKVKYKYQLALNGIAAWLTPQEAARVAKLPGVKSVHLDEAFKPTTDVSPDWIGASSVWAGVGPYAGTKGEGVLVGIIDTGINMDHPSFTDTVKGYTYTNPFGSGNYVGWCNPSNPNYDPSYKCNDKLVGAWDYADASWAGTADEENDGPEDNNGHGSHTASTTAGNTITVTMYAPTAAYTDTISGMAPHANIIMYDVCAGSCYTSDVVQAINQAITDTVDVLNESIGIGGDTFSGDKQQAYLNAVAAGIFSARSAGNDGPAAGTVGPEPPWSLSTAALTHDRMIYNYLTDMVSEGGIPPLPDITGLGFTSGYGPAEIVYAGDYTSTLTTTPELCAVGDPDDGTYESPWPPGTFNGEIVVCMRGTYARVEKSYNVMTAGAGGFVMIDNGGGLVADPHYVPGLHISQSDGADLLAWMVPTATQTATISGFDWVSDPSAADIMAGFSSRGPADEPDLIKPDAGAPGVSIWAAYKDNPGGEDEGNETVFMSGTSMASPHVAGAAALLTALHPSWSPSEIKSALMTTAVYTPTLKEDGATPTDPFDVGAGRIDIAQAALAGFVLDETPANYAAADPASGGDPKTLNLASLANDQCLLNCSWTRTISSTQNTTVTWVTSYTATADMVITVTPPVFDLPPFGTQEITITVDASNAPVDQWAFGTVEFSSMGATPDAHFPLAVKPTRGILPDLIEIETRRNAGSHLVEGLQSIEITDFTTEVFGLVAGDQTTWNLSQDPTNGNPFDNYGDGTTEYITVTVPADAKRLIGEVISSEAPDVDLYLGFGNTPSGGTLLCYSATASWNEYCELTDPLPGVYWILVQSWAGSASQPDEVVLTSAVVPGSDLSNMTVEGPTSVPEANPFDIRIYWDDPMMQAGDHYYGAISLGTEAGNPGNIATIPVNLIRLDDDVQKTASVEFANPGEVVTYTITILPNVTGVDLTYWLTDTVPAGLTLITATASAGTLNVMGDQIYWNGVMPGEWYYAWSTSDTDPLCTMPLAGFDGVADAYVDLAAFGLSPWPISGDSLWYSVSTSGDPITFYGQDVGNTINFMDDGIMFFDPSTPGPLFWINSPIPNTLEPNSLMAPFWRDFVVQYDASEPYGITFANLTSGGVPVGHIFEYDDVYPYGGDPATQHYDFEIYIDKYTDSSPGYYEIIFAYNNLTGDLITGTIGLENLDGTSGTQYAYNDLSSLHDGMAICFDYVPPTTPVEIVYTAVVDAGTEGQVLTNTVLHQTDNPGSKEASASESVTITQYGVEVTPPTAEASANPGESVDFVLTVENTGNVADTFNLSITGTWTATLSDMSVALNAGDSTTVIVTVDIPASAADGEMDTLTFTAASAGDPMVTDSADLTAISEWLKMYFPLVFK